MTLCKALLVAIACCIGAAAARAQSTPVWTDIDCSQLRIPAAIGLKCRGTQPHGRHLAGNEPQRNVSAIDCQRRDQQGEALLSSA